MCQQLAGIVEPNDGKCHVDPTSKEYTKSTTMVSWVCSHQWVCRINNCNKLSDYILAIQFQDYPSVAQVKKSLSDSRIQPIFAVTKKFAGLYKVGFGVHDKCKPLQTVPGKKLLIKFKILWKSDLNPWLEWSWCQGHFEVWLWFLCFVQGIADQWKDIGATTGELLNDSSNVVELIKDSYNVSI